MHRRSARAERRCFIADGPKAVESALAHEGCVVEVFATVDAARQYADLLGGAPDGTPVSLVEDRAMDALSDSVTPAGVVAVCRFLDRPLPVALGAGVDALDAGDRDEPEAARLVAICADVRDPGNAGTVIRCADAAGAAGVVLAGDSVDAYNAKTVRASVGSLFHLPVAIERDAAAAVAAAREAGLVVLAADGAGEVDLFEADELLARPTAWLFGNEAWGLPPELAELADHRVRIPIHGRAESLNLATAAAVCLYASARAQRA
ncbi:RNA methyltransferase [Nocardioides sp. GY 10113]|nr:RNA methyltransferase [Nocardioides sp. GY 10113]TIC80427.1 RNA methyltransferase [Nocardioides sp. GY 10113]TIC82512.1 RNA methyltransferase [Nocardioides sp. GY 10113]